MDVFLAPSTSPSSSSWMVGGRGCDASMLSVVLAVLGVESGGRLGFVGGEEKEGVAREGSSDGGDEKEGRW